MSYISHQNYNSQGEKRSDREVRHQGQGSHLKVTFQSTQQMLPICHSWALSPALILHPYLVLSASRCLCITFSFFCHCSSAFLLFLILLPLHLSLLPPSPALLMRQQGGSGVIKGSANERLSEVSKLAYLCQARG